MLIALNSDGARVYGSEARKEEEYYCQQCEQKVIPKKGHTKIHHFAHYPGSPSCVWWEPESEEHLLMKKRIMKLLKKDNDIAFAEFEYKLNVIDGGNLDLYPDVYVELKNGKRIAVECQISSKTLEDFFTKTIRYSRLGIYTLWLFSYNEDYDVPSHFGDFKDREPEPDDKELRISSIRLQSHRWYYGRIYTMDLLSFRQYNPDLLQDRIVAVHFHRVLRKPEFNEYAAENFGATFESYYPKTLRFTSSRIIENSRILCTDNGEIKIARFYDRKWW